MLKKNGEQSGGIGCARPQYHERITDACDAHVQIRKWPCHKRGLSQNTRSEQRHAHQREWGR